MSADDRLDRMMADPAAYFAEARARAREVIERDLERDRRRGISTVNVTDDLLRAMRQTECPRCGYRYKPTRRTRRYETATREALTVAALAFHALEVHGQTIGSLQAEPAR